MELEEKIEQIEDAIFKLQSVISYTDWAMLFPNTDDTVTFIEAKAKVLEGIKKFEKIHTNLKKVDNEQSQ